jgi:hypothetical protein
MVSPARAETLAAPTTHDMRAQARNNRKPCAKADLYQRERPFRFLDLPADRLVNKHTDLQFEYLDRKSRTETSLFRYSNCRSGYLLTGLPAELRNRICQYALTSPNDIKVRWQAEKNRRLLKPTMFVVNGKQDTYRINQPQYIDQ